MGIIEASIENGTLKELAKVGLVQPKDYSILSTFFSLRKSGKKKTDAVMETSIMCRACESTVWRTVRLIDSL